MDAPVTHDVFEFEGFCLDRRGGGLFRVDRTGRTMPVSIGSRALDVLGVLVSQPGELLSKQAMMQAVWPGMVVDEKNLTVQIATLRRVLDDGRTDRSCIQTEAGRGYRFVAPVIRKEQGEFARTEPLLAAPDVASPPAPGTQPAVPQRTRLQPTTVAAVAAVVAVLSALIVLVWAGGWIGLGKTPTPQLSIVVLPFKSLNGMDDATADTVTEDLTTELSRRSSRLSVTARNSAFTYKDKSIDVKRIGEELGVRYAVEGSVRNVGGLLRVTAQLVSTETGAHLWADWFEVGSDGIGHNVDDIVRQIGWILDQRIVDTEAARSVRERPSSPEVADLLLRARSIYNRPQTPERQAEVVPLYERAVELDPNSATALALLAEALLDSIFRSGDPTTPNKLRRAEELLRRAEVSRPDAPVVTWTRVYLLGMQNRCQELIQAAQRAIEVDPLSSGPHKWMGDCKLRIGRAAEAIEHYQQAIRVNPRNPQNYNRYSGLGYASLFLDRYDDAIQWFQRSLAANPTDSIVGRSNIYAAIAAAHALSGRTEEARSSAAEATKADPAQTVRSYYQYKITNPVAVAQVARMRDGMRLAGIRDHADEDADFGLPSDDILHANYAAPTPTTVPGARTIRTHDLAQLLDQKPLVLDTTNWGRSIPGAVGLWGGGIGGSVSDSFQDRLGRKVQQLSGGNLNRPVVAVGWNSERFDGRNLALRLVALGYTQVYWYRGGREAWEVAELPETELVVQEW